ncbi:MAG TPA: D-glycero-beta-D-manno-heptose-7-phosphate kinase [Alphaproteobacteria bacterium]|nr:D-glycero-beta-D-manno-heptose-7-phosphate kinase [Alphaproteobacteria bacterium]
MTHNADLAALVPRMQGARVLCVGDVMLDRFVYGHVDRISPEAPIPVLSIERDISMLGGAGNVVRNLVGLGAHAEFVSVVGKDAAGREVMELVGGLDSVDSHLLSESKRETTIKTRYVAGSQQLLRADRETIAEISPATSDDVVRIVASALDEAGVLVLSDYAKGVLTPAATEALIAAARNAKKPVVVDPKGLDFARYKGATLLTPNRRELSDAVQASAGTNEEVTKACRKLLKLCAAEAVLCTRGADGMSLVTANSVNHLPAVAREVFDVSGAGDTVVATVAAALAAGLSLLEAAELATVASAIVVGKVGTAVAYSDDLVRELHHEDLATSERKLVSLDQAVDEVAKWRHQGLRIGFTNGCFDLLHPGHVSLMAQARAACDRLVVGLNSDASVKRLKGEGRPVQGEAARAAVLSSLATVDLVVIFNEDTPLAVIEALRPEVLVKGADYKLDEVVGGDLVRGWGGRVLLAELAAGHSTTATIKRMAAK